MGMKFIEFTTKTSKFPILRNFRQHSPTFGLFPNIYFNQKTHRLKIGTFSYGSVSKRYQRSLSAQLSNRYLKTLTSTLFQLSNIYGVYLFMDVDMYIWSQPSEGICFELLRGLKWCKHSTPIELGVP